MAGKKGVVMGVANDHSIAYGIARALIGAGAEVGLSYQNEVLAGRLAKLAPSLDDAWYAPCDVGDPVSVVKFFAAAEVRFGKIDFLVHAIAFSDKSELRGMYLNTSRANFRQTMDISVYSLLEVTRAARAMMNSGASVLTLSYYGAEKMIPNYNVMGVAKAALEASVRYLAADLGGAGIRVNAVSAGPMRTLSASGIGQFRDMLRWHELNAPLKRNVSLEDVGNASLYLLSPLSGAVTGEVHHVDSGSNMRGMIDRDSAEEAEELSNRLSTQSA
ncbi:MAG: enoyl-ACP reductase [Alphaproteobacteria bacterium]|nr:enoyl-ACP reductase [Alphaproteobacteria bacterium]